MTLREKVIATAYTGTAFVKGDEIGAFYDYASEKLGYSVYSHEMASREFWQLLKEKSKDDFVDAVGKDSKCHDVCEEFAEETKKLMQRIFGDYIANEMSGFIDEIKEKMERKYGD